MLAHNKKNQTFISSLILISIIVPIILFSIPLKANAYWGVMDTNVFDEAFAAMQGHIETNTTASAASNKVIAESVVSQKILAAKTWTQKLWEQAKMAVARRLIQEVTKSIVNWINNGFHGAPLFLENPESFFKDIAKSELRNMVDMFGYDSLKYPFGKDFSRNIINSYKSQLEINAAYSLSNMMNATQATNYRNNFNVGGWNGFLINTQYPQNNSIGFQMLATDALAAKLQGTVQSNAQKVKTVLDQGQGFLSPQKCDPSVNPDYNNGTNQFLTPSFDPSAYGKYDPPACIMPEEDPITFYRSSDCQNQAAINAYKRDYDAGVAIVKAEWDKKNTCKRADGTSALMNTTPGTVIADQIKINLGSGIRQKELAAAMGNSLSIIFDTLLNKFIGDGLNSLASKINPPPPVDNFSYDGLSLGSPAGGTNSAWDSGPEEEIIVEKFKQQLNGYFIGKCTTQDSTGGTSELIDIPKIDCDKSNGAWKKNVAGKDYTPGDIANTKEEIKLMDNPPCVSDDPDCNANNPSNLENTDPNSPGYYTPGITQMMIPITKEAKTLDQCLPGPDKNWENRLQEEQDLASSRLSFDSGSEDQMKVRASNGILKDLKFAVDSFKNWITTKMINSMPRAIIYMDAIKGVDNFSQQLREVTDARRAKSQILSRLEAINASLDVFSDPTGKIIQPLPNTPEEKQLIAIRKQYNAIRPSISSTFNIEDRKSELDILKDQLANLKDLNIKCSNDRTKAGWGPIDETGKGNSTQNNIKEIDKFCNVPIGSGYSHGDIIRPYDTRNEHGNEVGRGAIANASGFTFRNPRNKLGDPGYQDLALVNAGLVYGDIICTGLCSWPDPFSGITGISLSEEMKTADNRRTDVNMNCNTIFKANTLDYTHAGELGN